MPTPRANSRRALAAWLCLCFFCVAVSPSACGHASKSGSSDEASKGASAYRLVRVAAGLERPLFVTAPPGDSDRLFIADNVGRFPRSGVIRILELAGDTLLATPFLTIATVGSENEQGLFAIAFHPDYANSGRFFVHYSDGAGRTVVERYQVSAADPDVADPSTAQVILRLDQPQTNHNGGWLGFGPDGYLYVSLGDGGGANDESPGHTSGLGNGQDPSDNLWGTILRLDVDGPDAYPADDERNYAIPASNPFVGLAGDDEIWAYGLRNPWRASFDRKTGDLYIADVGQQAWEEIDVQPASSPGGTNYGWRLREGLVATPTPPVSPVGGAKPAGAVDPIFVYSHTQGAYQGCAITGGAVYRGPIAALQGLYFFADYCSAAIASLRFDGSDPAVHDGGNYTDFRDRSGETAFQPDQGTLDDIVSFGEDDAGNLYVLDGDGEIFRLEPKP